MRKVELSLKEKEKYEIIKKLVETNGNKERARIKLKLTDACIHLWFGNTKTALHATIDDSTGHVVAAYFDTQETLR